MVVVIYLLLWLPPVQQKIKDVALQEVMKMMHNRMQVGNLDFRPFNRLQLNEVYVSDLQNDTLLYADKVSAGFDLMQLFSKRLLIKSVDLDDFVIKVNREKADTTFNFQFLIDAFASESPDTTASKMTIQIRNIHLKEGQLLYDVLSEPVIENSIFDANHIHIAHLQSNLDLNSIDIQQLNAQIYSLSFTEKSGLTVSNLQAKVRSKGNRIDLTGFELKFPHSELSVPEAWIDYSGTYDLKFEKNRIDLADFKMFSADLSRLTEDLTFSGELKGKFPEIQLSQLQADYGEHIHLKLLASMKDINHWENSPVELQIENFSMDLHQTKELHLPVKVGSIGLKGTLKGTVADAAVHLMAKSDRGTIQLEGTGGYEASSGNSHFDAALHSDNFNISELLQDTLYGLFAGQIQAKGTISSAGIIHAGATANINRFDFNGYAYNRIQATGSYRGDTVRLDLTSDDPNVVINLHAQANIGKKSPYAKLQANVDCIYLDDLNLLPDYKDAFLNMQLNADVAGFNPEKMNVKVAIDSLSLYTNKGAFHEPKIRLNYLADDSCLKHLDIASHIISARADGRFSYAGLLEALKGAFPVLFPDSKPYPKKQDLFAENLNFRVGMNNVNSIAGILDLPHEMPDSALFIGKFQNDGQTLNLSASAYTLFTEADTVQLSISLSNKNNNLAVIFNADNRSNRYDFDGSIDAEIAFIPKKGSMPDMNITFNPTVFVLNETDFDFMPASMEIRDGRYTVHNLSLNHSADEYIKADGVVSASRTDSLTIDISKFQLETLFGAMKAEIPLRGWANGQIVTRNLLAQPLILSRGFTINDILFSGNEIGNLNISSGWSSERNGLILRATLTHKDHPQSVVYGYVLPQKDSLTITANIRDIELKWFQELMHGTLYGLDGDMSANLKISGKISDPTITGTAALNQAKIGINQLNTLYSINDSVVITPKSVDFKQFTIYDPHQHALTVNGKIAYRSFGSFNPNLSMNLNDFLVLDNAHQTDSLFYGNMRINGSLNLKDSGKNWLLSGNIRNSDHAKIWVNLPSSASSAQQYNGITYINTETENPFAPYEKQASSAGVAIPLKLNLSLALNPDLEINAIFDPETGDKAQVMGNGLINFLYDMNTEAMSLTGDYTITSGQATLSLVNVARKTFTVQPGGKLIFRGDPMATTFNITALYNLRADLASLDPSFNDVLITTKVPVTCSLTASGNINEMDLKYNVLLPGEQADIQKKIDGLLYTDDLKIKEIAYLLAFGSFLSVSSGNNQSLGAPNLANSLASLTTGGLNKLLSSVLSDNWSIGTDLRTSDANFNTIDMGVNVNTSLFQNRLMLTGTVGYNNDPNRINNFTGDFNVEYKLNPAGNILLKFYNVTNNQYYEQAKTTQGVGVVYKKEARTFKQLFENLKRKLKKK
ncbi:DUF490 domain-containing protein [Bacteroidia bacterium]|nr:DUF490 domain-containing protein [Bacteroidia bacterium]